MNYRDADNAHTSDGQSGKKSPFTLSSNIIFTNCCKVNRDLYFGQLPPLELPEEQHETGGETYTGEIAYGKEMAPMWIVTSYRLATN